MKKIELSILDLSKICIFTNLKSVYEIFEKNPDKILKTIPITDILIKDNEQENDINENKIVIINSEQKKMIFDKNNNVAYMSANNENMRFPDLIYTILEMFVNDLLPKRKYLLHSSSLKYDDNKSFILTGDANSGKSSLAYKFMNDYKFQLISNDHTLLGLENDKLITLTGTKEIEMRVGILKQNFNSQFVRMNINSDEDIWSKKIIVNDYINKELISSNDKTYVTDIFQIDIISNGDTFIKEKDYIDQRLYLYEQLSKIIKATYNLITGFNYPLPSLETEVILNQLDVDVQTSLENTKIHIAKGTLDNLSKEMVKILEKK